MDLKVLLTLVLCAVIVNINCERTKDCNTSNYVRIKRAKYSYPPHRFYRAPPMIQPIKGIFSYTPPPNYMMDDDKQPPPYRPSRVSKRPTEDEINNIVKYMTQKDLDKLIEMAEKEKYIHKYRMPEKYERDERTKPGSGIYKTDVQEMNAENLYAHFYGERGDYVKESMHPKIIYRKPSPYKEFISQQSNYQGINPNTNYMKNSLNKLINQQYITDYEMNVRDANYMEDNTKYKYSNVPNIQNGLVRTTYIENIPSHIQTTGLGMNEVNDYFNFVQNFDEMLTKNRHIYTDSSLIKEEELPKPANLWEEEQVVSNTNNVPTVVKADSSYEVKNFGDLPLMNYDNSKLHSVSSYNVPHYTVSNFYLA